MKMFFTRIAVFMRFALPLIVILLCVMGFGAINLGHRFWLILLIILSAVSLISLFLSSLLKNV